MDIKLKNGWVIEDQYGEKRWKEKNKKEKSKLIITIQTFISKVIKLIMTLLSGFTIVIGLLGLFIYFSNFKNFVSALFLISIGIIIYPAVKLKWYIKIIISIFLFILFGLITQ